MSLFLFGAIFRVSLGQQFIKLGVRLSTSPQADPALAPPTDLHESVAEQRAVAIRGHVLFAVGIFLLLALCYKISRELEIIYVSALFAVVLMPLVRSITALNLRGYRPSNGVAVVVILVIAIVAFGGFVTLGLPPVVRDFRNFITEAPQRIPATVARIKRLPMAGQIDVDDLAARVENFAGAIGSYVVNAIPAWLSHILDILTTVFLTIYFILEGDQAYDFFLSLFPSANRRRLDITLRKASLKMSKWLFGQGTLMLCMGVTFIIAFYFLHVRYFLLLGVLMGIFNIIPIAGGAITMSLSLIVASIDSWGKMFGVLIVYVVYVNLENAVLTPRIMRSSLNMMGLTVLIALLVGTAIAGIVGALVAVPTAALVSVLLDEYAVQR
jgi:predicted PurR-regulated permease PerM